MGRVIRIDDFPHGDLAMFERGDKYLYRKKVAAALSIFEKKGVSYILGASPLLFQDGDVAFLNSVVGNGKVVMHGFTHGWELPWGNITSFWKCGGEFANLSVKDIAEKYEKSMQVMSQVTSFSEEDFIPPFNCYTQALLDFLKDTPVKRIHTCDHSSVPSINRYNHYNIEPVVSKYGVTYSDADVVIKNLHDPSQITLHWCYDCANPSWLQKYNDLCNRIIEMEET